MYLVIYNTTAGKGNVKKVVRKLSDDLINQEIPFTLFNINQFSSDIAKELMQSGQVHRVMICGGDGTVNRAINMLVEQLPGIELGIIPCGYGNIIARSLQTHTSLEEFVSNDNLTGFSTVQVSQANNQYFLNVASIGLTADTVSAVEKFRRKPLGSVFYNVFGGLITHILFFFAIKTRHFIFNLYYDYPPSITWLRTDIGKSKNAFSVFYDLRAVIGQYKSIFLPKFLNLRRKKKNFPARSNEYKIEREYPFSWQIDGEPQYKTRFLKIALSCQVLKILTINYDNE